YDSVEVLDAVVVVERRNPEDHGRRSPRERRGCAPGVDAAQPVGETLAGPRGLVREGAEQRTRADEDMVALKGVRRYARGGCADHPGPPSPSGHPRTCTSSTAVVRLSQPITVGGPVRLCTHIDQAIWDGLALHYMDVALRFNGHSGSLWWYY